MKVTKELLDSLNGVQKSPRQRSLEETLDLIETNFPSKPRKARQQPPVDDLTPETPEATPTTPTKTLKTRSEPQKEVFIPNDEYEQGYQDGQTDAWETYLLGKNNGLNLVNRQSTLALGHDSTIYTIQVTADSDADKIIQTLLQLNQKSTPPLNTAELPPPSV